MRYGRKMHNRIATKNAGFTLIETLVTIAIVVVFLLAIYQLYAKVLEVGTNIRVRIVASQVASEQMEFIRNLQYSDVGTVGGVPSGVVSPSATVVRSGISFLITTTIRNIDQPADGTLGGTPNDLSPADNKFVSLSVACTTCKYPVTVENTSYVAPKSLETENGNGALVIKAIDASGNPIVNAIVSIVNSAVSPAINLSDVTDASGVLTLVDAPPSTENYQITVSKSGYSTDTSYTPHAAGNPNPLKPHLTVVANTVTQSTFAIDRTGTITVAGQSPMCAAISGVSGNFTGQKIIGTSPDVIKTTIPFTETGAGALLSNVEWDTYSASITGTTYDIAGTNPLLPLSLLPGSNQTVTLTLAPHVANRLVVGVVDNAGLPIAGATVTATGPGGPYSNLTSIGSASQTDWSGGAGQTDFTDATKFWTTDGNADVMTTPGQVSILKSGGVYAGSATLESSTIDLGAPATLQQLSWGPFNQPSGIGATPVRFQIASNTDNATWNYVGPDGTAATYYTATTSTISSVHTNTRYVRYKIFLSTTDTSKTPIVQNISITYTSGCLPPGQVDFGSVTSGSYTITASKTGYTDNSKTSTITGATYETITLTP